MVGFGNKRSIFEHSKAALNVTGCLKKDPISSFFFLLEFWDFLHTEKNEKYLKGDTAMFQFLNTD